MVRNVFIFYLFISFFYRIDRTTDFYTLKEKIIGSTLKNRYQSNTYGALIIALLPITLGKVLGHMTESVAYNEV